MKCKTCKPKMEHILTETHIELKNETKRIINVLVFCCPVCNTTSIPDMISVKKIGILMITLALGFTLFGCSPAKKMLLDEKMKVDEIDKIQVVLAMGNPEYGADSKIIMDKDEIKEIVDALNNAAIGDEVKDGDIGISFPSLYLLYNGDSLIHEFSFNGNNSEKIWLNSKCYTVKYSNETPYELYQGSNAETISVDEKLNEMN